MDMVGTGLPTGRAYTSAVWDGSNAYIFGGGSKIVRFNPATNTVATMSATLPTARGYTSAVWDGSNAYIFGGYDGADLNQIVRYDPSTNTVTTMSATLPTGRSQTSAVWDGTHAYIFGGSSGGGYLGQIVRYDPATNTVATMSATLPTARGYTSAAWNGSSAFLFGGFGCTTAVCTDYGYFSEIVRYDPSTNTVTTMSAALPSVRALTSAVWDGSNAYIFGGVGSPTEIVRYNSSTNTVTTMSATLPTGRWGTSAVWDGARADIFGGANYAYLNRIVRYDPSTNTATTLGTVLPTARGYTSAVWDGSNAYIFGGRNSSSYLRQIVRYDPATNTVTTMSATLPTPRWMTSAVWDGSNAYIFGGGDDSGYMGQIVRYDPATNTVTTMSATLPTARRSTSAVWDGANAYVFGGQDGSGYLSQIVRYDPATNTVATMSATLPTARTSTSAVWDGSNAYIFGGFGCTTAICTGTGYFSEIVRYDPSTNTVTTMSATLPFPGLGTSAVWDGTHAYIFGGSNSADLKYIVQYSPTTDTVVTMGATLPSDRSYTSAVWDGGNAYVFGGVPLQEDIVRYRLDPGPPLNLQAARGPGLGQITLTWQAPASNTFVSPITNYRVYASSTSGAETILAELGNVLTFTDSGLPNGARRYYRVSAVNAVGEGPQGYEASAVTFTQPSAPLNLVAAPGPDVGQIRLTWAPPLDNGGIAVTSYRVHRGSTSGAETFLTEVATLTFTDAGLADGERAYYRVSAVNALGEGPQGNEATNTAPTLPSAPASLSTTRGPGRGEVTLGWQAPTDTGGVAVRYRVYAGSASGAETFVAETNVATFRETGLADGATRWYRVSAVNAVGEGPLSNEASGTAPTPPSAPRNLAAEPALGLTPSTLGARLRWAQPADSGGVPLTAFRIYRDGAFLVQTVGLAYTDTTCRIASQCSYEVRAVNVVGPGPASNAATTLGTGLP